MKLVSAAITRSIGRHILVAKKNSPHVFFIGGLVGTVGSTVLACRATLKLEETLDEIKTDIDNAKVMDDTVVLTEQEHARNMGQAYGMAAYKLGKLYGPSIAVGVVSISALTGSHIQMTRRNTALTATLAAVSKAYDDYRERVRAELGEERELEVYRAISDEKVEGVSKPVKVTNPDGHSPYARVFDETSSEWQKDAERNRIFLQCQQNYWNHRLIARGHVFLNEVYDALGFERTSAGSVVGWIVNKDGVSEGDGYIDFGIYEAVNARFINSLERSVWLDFNVDGVIYDRI